MPALTLPDNAPAPDGLIEQRVPAGRYARAVHKGGYEGLPATWNALKNEWLPKSGHTMRTTELRDLREQPDDDGEGGAADRDLSAAGLIASAFQDLANRIRQQLRPELPAACCSGQS